MWVFCSRYMDNGRTKLKSKFNALKNHSFNLMTIDVEGIRHNCLEPFESSWKPQFFKENNQSELREHNLLGLVE